MHAKNLFGAATRYIAGRNAVQTVYWRSASGSPSEPQKFSKVSRTVRFGNKQSAEPPLMLREEKNIRFT